MKKLLLVLILIGLLAIVGCSNSKEMTPICNKPYILVGTECCLDQNDNSICDRDEVIEEEKDVEESIQEEKEPEEIKKEYAADFEITALLKSYSQSTKKLTLRDISYKLTNFKDELDDLKMKFEIYQEGKKIVESSYIELLEDEEIIKSGEITPKRKYMGIEAFPRMIGKHNFPIEIKTYLYQGDELLSNKTGTYYILNKEGDLSVEINGIDKTVYIDERIAIENIFLNPPYSFNYNKVKLRFSRDNKIDFMIKRSEASYFQYQIKSLASEPIKRDFELDYYCQREIDGQSFSFLIYDFHSYLDDLYYFKVNKDQYNGLPDIINPNEQIILTVPKYSCDKSILLLRKGDSYYLRAN